MNARTASACVCLLLLVAAAPGFGREIPIPERPIPEIR